MIHPFEHSSTFIKNTVSCIRAWHASQLQDIHQYNSHEHMQCLFSDKAFASPLRGWPRVEICIGMPSSSSTLSAPPWRLHTAKVCGGTPWKKDASDLISFSAWRNGPFGILSVYIPPSPLAPYALPCCSSSSSSSKTKKGGITPIADDAVSQWKHKRERG